MSNTYEDESVAENGGELCSEVKTDTADDVGELRREELLELEDKL